MEILTKQVQIRDVRFKVSPSGNINPVLVLAQEELFTFPDKAFEVNAFVLSDIRELAKLKVREFLHVSMPKEGSVKFGATLGRSIKFKIPNNCPSCNSELNLSVERKLICTNKKCLGKPSGLVYNLLLGILPTQEKEDSIVDLFTSTFVLDFEGKTTELDSLFTFSYYFGKELKPLTNARASIWENKLGTTDGNSCALLEEMIINQFINGEPNRRLFWACASLPEFEIGTEEFAEISKIDPNASDQVVRDKFGAILFNYKHHLESLNKFFKDKMRVTKWT